MDALERLLAVQEIGDVIARYRLCFDGKDWDTFGELWTEDAAFVANGVAFEGRDTLLAFLSTCLPANYSGLHMNSPPLVELSPDGTSATAKTSVVWITQNFENTILAHYDDVLVKRNGSWQFLRRVETELPFVPGPPPMSEDAAATGTGTRK